MSTSATGAKTERLLNLVIALLSARIPFSKEKIRVAVPQYQEAATTEAFERMFERDKDELRELGIPLIVAPVDPAFDDEVGYRIDRSRYALPDISFEPDELAALALAGRAWAQATLAGPANGALRKLRAAGVEVDDAALLGLESRVHTNEPAFEPLRKAVMGHQPVSFDYRKSGRSPEPRVVEPWALTSVRGRWYLTGWDRDRRAQRVFRLTRIDGAVRTVGKAGSYQVPTDHRPRVEVERAVGEPRPTRVLLRVAPGAGHRLRERATGQDTPVDAPDGWSELALEADDLDRLTDELAWYGPDVVVLSPPELADGLRDRFAGALRAHRSRPSGTGPDTSPGRGDGA